MKTKMVHSILTGLAATTGALSVSAASPQVEITRISVEDNVYSPYYEARTVLDHQQGAAQKWIQLHVEYTTSGGWIDELEITQMAYVTDSELGQPVVLEDKVTYINVKPGDHYANVYIHPNLVERYAVDASEVDTAAVFMVNGRRVAHKENTRNVEKGWSDESGTLLHKGHLLNHAETPFWFINYDFKEIIKRGDHAHVDGGTGVQRD